MSKEQKIYDKINTFYKELTPTAKRYIDTCDQGGIVLFENCETAADVEEIVKEIESLDEA